MSKLYERLPNGRYREARETVAMDSLPEGAHLIIVRPGSRATIHNIEPDHAALVAAAHDALPAMCRAVIESSGWNRNEGQPWTARELKAWEAFRRAVGSEALGKLRVASAMNIAEAGVDALVKAAAGEKEGAE